MPLIHKLKLLKEKFVGLELFNQLAAATAFVWAASAAIWTFLASMTGIEPWTLLESFGTSVLPYLLAYGFLAAFASIGWWRWLSGREGNKVLVGSAFYAFALAAVVMTGFSDIKARSRQELIIEPIRVLEESGCSGRWAEGLEILDRLSGSDRFSFLLNGPAHMRNRIELRMFLAARLGAKQNQAMLEESGMLYGYSNSALSKEKFLRTHDRWLRLECKR